MASKYSMGYGDLELQKMMQTELQGYYKKLADIKMENPKKAASNMHLDGIQLDKLIDLHNKADLSLWGSENDSLEEYVIKFRHFVHLFFADEKLELESKFKDNITVKYVAHRRAGTGTKKKRYSQSTPYAVYHFKIPPTQNIEDFELYMTISIEQKKGKVTHIDRNKGIIEVAFEDGRGLLKFEEDTNYFVEIEFNERQYVSFLRSLWLIGHYKKATFAVFPDPSELMSKDEFDSRLKEFKLSRANDENFLRFDEKQKDAIFSIVNGVHGNVPYVLWGPPGTGKTVTLVECIRQLLQMHPKYRILVCTPSNSAADLIARKVLNTAILHPREMRRYYSLGRNVNERDIALDDIIRIENCAMYGIYDDRFQIDDFKVLLNDNVRLIFSTLVCSAYLEEQIPEDDFFSHIFIDEAGQSLEPETLIPISRFATKKTRVVLCGDHQQLGPVLKAHFLKKYKSCNMSLMERLMTTMRLENYEAKWFGNSQMNVYADGRTFCQLTDSYRCHPKIIQFSSDNFYAGTLRAVNEKNRSSFCDWEYLPSKGFPLIFHAIRSGTEVKQIEGRSYHNEEETEVVLKYIQLLKASNDDLTDNEIGVISPYKFQTHKIREHLKNTRITVDSVECYQGSERRVIILTLSRSKQIGFLSEYKRLNTSITRAKELFIVVASLDFVRQLQPYQRQNYWIGFIKYCAKNKAILIDGFAGEKGFSKKTLENNCEEINNCLCEKSYANMAHEARKKRPAQMDMPKIVQKQNLSNLISSPAFSPFSRAQGPNLVQNKTQYQRNWWNSTPSSSESDDEDQGTASDSSLSSDDEGQKYWAKQIPWKAREFLKRENLANWEENPAEEKDIYSVNCLMVDSQDDDYEELNEGMQRLNTCDDEEERQYKSNSSEDVFEKNSFKSVATPVQCHPQKYTAIPEERVRDSNVESSMSTSNEDRRKGVMARPLTAEIGDQCIEEGRCLEEIEEVSELCANKSQNCKIT